MTSSDKKSTSVKLKPKTTKGAASNRDKTTVLIIGVGNMGSSLARGLLKSELMKSMNLRLFDHNPELMDPFSKEPNIEWLNTLKPADAEGADVIVLCTKPQDLPAVAKAIGGKIGSKALLISILAAITTDDLATSFKFKGAIVRAMPNIAATISEAATALCKNTFCDVGHADLAHQMFTSVGTASWTKESLMDAVTGLSGSGPAYIYMVIESLTDGGVKMGLPRPLALELATQTVLGSAMLVQSTGLHPALLRDQVTTPGGTTISAIHELEERGLRAMLISAVETATLRSQALR
jgi:pyrroline-5-carboxylate reductase